VSATQATVGVDTAALNVELAETIRQSEEQTALATRRNVVVVLLQAAIARIADWLCL
jgi:hypothetical protein